MPLVEELRMPINRGADGAGGAPVDGGIASWDDGLRLPVLDERAAWQVADILAAVPPPEAANASGLAFKTGTSYGYRDAWALGFDGRHVVGVWVGRPDGAPVPGLTGITAAAPLLVDVFARDGIAGVIAASAVRW